jgi:hypothetical protein
MADLEGGVSGALGGAAAGAAIGTAVPGIGSAVGAVGGGLLGGVAGLFGSGGSTETGMTLPPSLEYRMINDAYSRFQLIEQDYKRVQQMTQFYEQRYNMLSEDMLQGVPEAEVRQKLGRQTADMAANLGMPVGDAIKQGFLSQDDINDLQMLAKLEDADLRDPRYEQARDQQKQQLMANLQRQGASPEMISQALQDFENTSTVGRFEVADQMRTTRSALISNRMGLRQGSQRMWFDMGSSVINTQMGLQNQWQNQMMGAAQLMNMGQQTAVTGIGLQAGLRGEQQGTYDALGQYKFSKDAKGYLKQDPFSTGQLQSYSSYKMDQQGAKMATQGGWNPLTGQRNAPSAQTAASGREMQARAAGLAQQEQDRVKRMA